MMGIQLAMNDERSISIDLPYAAAVAEVKDALSTEGFGVLSELDVRATLREKRGVAMEDYVILGACDPDLAHQALEVERSIGVQAVLDKLDGRGGAPK